jgi:tRNA pseudouridine55 synthase
MAGMYDGILNLDKPRGWTSHDVVARMRRLLAVRLHLSRSAVRVGHAGTLDPLASGVLLVCIGQATRVAEYLMAGEKAYRAVIDLGVSTDTYDIEGRVMATAPVPSLDRQDLEHLLIGLTGETLQTPPPFSAIKQQGVPAYRKARRGEPVSLAPRRVVIHSMVLLAWDPPRAVIELVCDSGTYVRSIAHDLGRLLGCGAALAGLIRLRSGCFKIQDAVALDEAAAAIETGDLARYLSPIRAALTALSPVPVDGELAGKLLHGQSIPGPAPQAERLGYAVEPGGAVRAILAYDAGTGLWRPRKVFPVGT